MFGRPKRTPRLFLSFPELDDFQVNDDDVAFVARQKQRLDEEGLRMPSVEAKNALYGEGQNYVRIGLNRQALLCYLLAIDATYGSMPPSEVTTYQSESPGVEERVVEARDITSELKNAGSSARKLGAYNFACNLYLRALNEGRADMFLLLTYTYCLTGELNKAFYWALRGSRDAGFHYFVSNAMSYLEHPPEDMTHEAFVNLKEAISFVVDTGSFGE